MKERTTLYGLLEKGHTLFLHHGSMGTSTLELKDREKMKFLNHGTMNEIIIRKDIFVEPTDKIIIDGIIKSYKDGLSRNEISRKGASIDQLRGKTQCLYCGKDLIGKKYCNKEHRRAYRKQQKQAKKKTKTNKE